MKSRILFVGTFFIMIFIFSLSVCAQIMPHKGTGKIKYIGGDKFFYVCLSCDSNYDIDCCTPIPITILDKNKIIEYRTAKKCKGYYTYWIQKKEYNIIANGWVRGNMLSAKSPCESIDPTIQFVEVNNDKRNITVNTKIKKKEEELRRREDALRRREDEVKRKETSLKKKVSEINPNLNYKINIKEMLEKRKDLYPGHWTSSLPVPKHAIRSENSFWGSILNNANLKFFPILFLDTINTSQGKEYVYFKWDTKPQKISIPVNKIDIYKYTNSFSTMIRPSFETKAVKYFRKYKYIQDIDSTPKYEYDAMLNFYGEEIFDAISINTYPSFIKIIFPEKINIKIAQKNISEKNTPDNKKYIIWLFATEHALSLASLNEWDDDWGYKINDNKIERKIFWFKIGAKGNIEEIQPVGRFSDLIRFKKRNDYIVKELDGKPVFNYLYKYLKDYNFGNFHHAFLIKDSWDTPVDGIDDLKFQMQKLLVGDGIFDIISIKSKTTTHSLRALVRDLNGKFEESKYKYKIQTPHYNYGERINGRIRKYIRNTLQNEIKNYDLFFNELVVKEDDPYFKFGNLFHVQHVATLFYFFQCILDVSETKIDHERSVSYLIEKLVSANLFINRSDSIASLFNKWFFEFRLSSQEGSKNCPLINKNIDEILIYCKNENGKGRKYIKNILNKMTIIFKIGPQNGRYFIPNEIFFE